MNDHQHLSSIDYVSDPWYGCTRSILAITLEVGTSICLHLPLGKWGHREVSYFAQVIQLVRSRTEVKPRWTLGSYPKDHNPLCLRYSLNALPPTSRQSKNLFDLPSRQLSGPHLNALSSGSSLLWWKLMPFRKSSSGLGNSSLCDISLLWLAKFDFPQCSCRLLEAKIIELHMMGLISLHVY